MCEWIVQALNDIPSEMVIKSFLVCGISNSTDGTEDDRLFEEFTTNCECESTEGIAEDSYVYDPALTDEQVRELFNRDDDRDFEGF